MELDKLTLDWFEPKVGEVFGIDAAPERVELVLHSALALGEWPGGRQPFSLAFRGPREPALPQATYRLDHAELGSLEIFIVPIGQDGESTTYEAVFT